MSGSGRGRGGKITDGRAGGKRPRPRLTDDEDTVTSLNTPPHIPEIDDPKSIDLNQTPLGSTVTVRVFMYFLFDLNPLPTLKFEEKLTVKTVNYGHILWSEIEAPLRNPISFQVKVGNRYENKKSWDVFTNTRMIPGKYVEEGMIYLDFINEKFDGIYLANTTSEINSIVPFKESALFLGTHLEITKFEQELNFLFSKMRTHTLSYVTLSLNLNEIFEELNKQSQSKTLPKEEVFVKTTIISSCCLKIGISVANRFFSPEITKNALPCLGKYPQYVKMAKDLGISGSGRNSEGMFFLVSTIALAQSNLDFSEFLRHFKSKTEGNFTKDELEVVSQVQWARCSGLKIHHLCATLSMGNQIHEIEKTVEHLLGEGIKEYAPFLQKLEIKKYLQEWKYCLLFSPHINHSMIPFSLGSEKFRVQEKNVQDQSDLQELFGALSNIKNLSPNQRIWVQHLREQVKERVKRQTSSPQQFVIKLFDLVKSMNNNELITREIHKILPKVGDKTLIPRVKYLIFNEDLPSILLNLERDSISEIFRNLQKEDLLEINRFLSRNQNKVPTQNGNLFMELYEICWDRLVSQTIKDMPISNQKHMYLLKTIRKPSDDQNSDLFYCLVSEQILDLFNEAFSCHAFPSRMTILENDAETLAKHINDMEILPEVIPFLSEKDIMDRLLILLPSGVLPDLNRLQKRQNELREEWTSFLECLVVMKSCPEFLQEASVEHIKYSKEFKQLETESLKRWKTPNCHPQFRRVSEHLKQLKNSIFFSFRWNDPSYGQTVALCTSGKELTERWVEYFEIYENKWKILVQEIDSGEAKIPTIEAVFKQILHQLGSRYKGDFQKSTEAEVRQQMEKSRKSSKEELEKIITQEIEIFFSLTKIRLDKGIMFQRIFDCLMALVMVEDIIAVNSLLNILNIEVHPTTTSFCNLFKDPKTKAQTPFQTVVGFYIELVQVFPKLKLVIQGFPSLFQEVMFQQDLFQVVNSFNDSTSLNSRIDVRQGEDIREETHDILHCLRLLCDSHSILPHPVFLKIKRRLPLTAEELFNFLVACGGAVVALSIIQDKMKKGGIQMIKESLQSDSEEKQTITIVKNLMVNGKFGIQVKNGRILVSASFTSPDHSQKEIIQPEELEALPSQLLLTSGVVTKNQAEYDVDAPLPENIARLEDRECYVLRFNKIFDTIFQLSEVVKKLCNSGHPDYQEITISCDCCLPYVKLQEFVKEREQLLSRWMTTFSAFRQTFPILSFLSRSQLVSCLSALRRQNIDLLFSTMQSIGCNPNSMNKSLKREMEEGLNIQKASELFKILSTCLNKHFDVGKLKNETKVSLPQVQNPLTSISSHFKVLKVANEQNMEEVVCSAHVALHKRTPCPIEVLFCSPNTTEIDVEDFLDRWAFFSDDNYPTGLKEVKVTFWLVQIENLSYPIQTLCIQRLFKIVENLPQTHPKLFLVTRADQRNYISSILIREEIELNTETCTNMSSLLLRPISESQKNVYVVTSSNCGEGKTTTIIKKLVADKVDEQGLEVLHVQFSLDTTPMSVILTKLLKARPMTSKQGLVLHFNVGHQVNPKDVNLFLVQYLLISSWRDTQGFTFPKHENDTIIIELCNTGKLDERDRIPISKYFQQLPLDLGISHVGLRPISSPISKLFYSFRTDNESFILGTQILISIFSVLQSGAKILPRRSELHGISVKSSEELSVIVKSIICENYCTKHHLMMDNRNTPCSGGLGCRKCKRNVAPDERFSLCKPCNFLLCNLCMNQMPVGLGSELLFVRRYFWFIVTQLQNFHFAFQEQWDFVDILPEEGFMYLKWAFHCGRMILSCSKNLAKPAMIPFDERHPQDEVQRCRNMDKFESWREIPFVLVTPNAFHMTSTSVFSPLQFIMDNELETSQGDAFHQWIKEHSVLDPVDRSQLQLICSQMIECPYSVDQKNPPLKILLEVLGCWEGPKLILNVIQKLTSRNILGTTRLSQLLSWDDPAFNFLKNQGRIENMNMTCTEFLTICSNYLNSLFGNSVEKPGYTLTADNILRIMAVQMRLISGIPVCIMGETGCGKTETLHFLSSISGKDFQVINVQEGIKEKDFYGMIKPTIQRAKSDTDKQFVVVLDEVNTSSSLWTAKDMLCDHICFGVRIPRNIVFVIILNPWKVRTPAQQEAIAKMDVGGLDFLKYQNTNKVENQTHVKALNLVYQVHKSPETLSSLVWDWGSSSTTFTPINELRKTFEGSLLVKDRTDVTDELLMASSMTSWLIKKIENVPGLRENFKRAGDGTEGLAFWMKFRTILVELFLESQDFLRHVVYLDELSVVSLRDIRKACELIELIFVEFWCGVRIKLQKDLLSQPFAFFRFLSNATQVALVNTYCLRLDADRRLAYLIRIQTRWGVVRSWFSDIHPDFMTTPPPAANCPSYDECEFYKSFNELATYIVKDLEIENGIAVNQALKENTFGVLCAVCTKSTLFIVGRPGSTKSRTLELLIKATENNLSDQNFLGNLGIVIQKHVIQCSPYTTAHHVRSNARRAAMAQIAADKIHNSRVKRINVIVLEEVGATIGSVHNPLMSLHSMIDHGIEVEGRRVRLPIIGVSNYRLDASKMGRGRVVYRGNPPLNDLELTARAILRGLGEAKTALWIKHFSMAFSLNILQNEDFTWYYGMRDFYATVSSIRILATPLEQTLQISQLSRGLETEVNSHITRWAVLINLRGFPEKQDEETLAEAMQSSFGFNTNVLAKWEWKVSEDADPILLCDCCCRLQLNRLILSWQSSHPNEELTNDGLISLFKSCTRPVMHQSFCQYFDDRNQSVLPAAEVIGYSLREITSRHVMVFTKANAALLLLFSMGLVKRDQCTVIFQSSSSKDQATSTSELVQQMMRIKACMKEGKTLILVKSRHLYESMLDALNVHYTKDRSSDGSDDLHKTMLSMAGVTQSVFVQPTFRCIVLEDQDELKSYVLPPMINRFSKTVLTYASALNPLQIKTRTAVLQKSIFEIDDQHKINLLQFLIPGLSEESLDSAVYAFSDFDEVVRRLTYCFSRKNLRRLTLQLVEGLNSSSISFFSSFWNHSWIMNRCNSSFEELVEEALFGAQHLMIISEQLQLSASSLARTFEKVFQNHDKTQNVALIPSQMTILNQASSGDVQAVLSTLKKFTVQHGTSAMSVFILDTTATSQSVLLDSFMYAVSSELFDEYHHVVLIVVVSDFAVPSKEKKLDFSFSFDSSWAQLFVDEVVPRSFGTSETLQCSHLDELEKDALLHEILQPQLLLSLALQKDNLTTLCQSLSSSAWSVQHNISLIEKILSVPSNLRDQIVNSVIENTRTEGVSFPDWAKLAFQKAKYSSDSLRSTYLDYLGSFVVRILHQLLSVLMQFDSLSLGEKPEMLDLISTLMRNQDIVPPCDIKSCLNLVPLSLVRSGDIESNKGLLLFPKFSRTEPGQLTRVSFPLSPFVITHILNLGPEPKLIQEAIQSMDLDKISPNLVDKYFHDALCIGASVSPQRLPLLKKIVKIFHPSAFDTIWDFHSFISEQIDWFKSVIKFCMEPFEESSMTFFRGETVENLVQLASIEGVVPLDRVESLINITKNDESIDWRIIRAMAMIDSVEGRNKEEKTAERRVLCDLAMKFRQNEVDGIISVLGQVSNHFIKYFFFEIFSSEKQPENETILQNTLSILTDKDDLSVTLQNHEGVQSGISFLLRKAFIMLFQMEEPEKTSLFVHVSNFIFKHPTFYILSSHCIFHVIMNNNILVQLDQNFISKFVSRTPFSHFIRMCLLVSISIDMLDLSPEESVTYHQLIQQLLQNDNEDITEITLFLLRQLSCGGTVDISRAVFEVRGGKFPDIISQNPVIDEVSMSLQRVSPLGSFPGFVEAVASVCEFAVSKMDSCLKKFKESNAGGKMACIASYCFLVAPQPLEKFQTEIYPIVVKELSKENSELLKQLINNRELLNLSENLRELILCIFLSITSNNHALVFYKNLITSILAEKVSLRQYRLTIEDMMIPKCPRCNIAFFDWDGCFSVNCKCGCSFCGHCLLDCGSDAHPHVLANHGSYYGTIEQFRREFGVIASSKIRNFIKTIPSRVLPLLEAELPSILEGNLFYVRAEQVLNQTQNISRKEDIPPIIETFTEILTRGCYIWDRVTNPQSEAPSLENLLKELKDLVNKVNQLLFPATTSDSSSFTWIHAMIWKLRILNGQIDRKRIQEEVLKVIRQHRDPLSLLGEFDKVCGSHQSGILSLLRITEEELKRSQFNISTQRSLLCLPRTIFFKQQFWSHLKTNYEKYPVLNFLNERKTSITNNVTSSILEIVQFLRQLQEFARIKRITRAFASTEGSFYKFINDVGEPLSSLVTQFEKNFYGIFRLTTHWQCKSNIHNLFEHMLEGIPKDVKLECFLPSNRGLGILSMILWGGRNGDSEGAWAGLPLVQNSLYEIVHGGNNNDKVRVAGSPYFLTKRDIISVDTQKILEMINELFLVPGSQPRLSNDLPVAEKLCKYGRPRLAFFPYLSPELPEFQFGLEGIMDMFRKVQIRMEREENRSFTTLPNQLSSGLKGLIQRLPHAGELLFSFCCALLVHQSGEDVALGKEVSEIKIQMPLTEEQQQGRQTLFELPTAIKSFHVEHIPALMGLSWNSKNLHETASIPIDDQDQIQEIQTTLQKIITIPELHRQIPNLLGTLRTAGICHFSQEINQNFAETPLIYYLTTIPVPFIDDEHEITVSHPFQTNAKHFNYILREAERLLGPHELSSPVNEELCVIPMSAVRQFLQSHIVEDPKDTRNNNKNKDNNNNNNNNNNNQNNQNSQNNNPRPERLSPNLLQPSGEISISSSNLFELEL